MRSHIGRLIWVLLTNGAFLCLAVLGYSREADLQHMLHPEQAVSFSHLIGNDPWDAIAVAALTIGIVLEATWSKAGGWWPTQSRLRLRAQFSPRGFFTPEI
jgi:hypothetical protein